MTKNPFINAFSALAYVSLVVLVMSSAERMGAQPDKTILGPIAFLSLFTLSAATMGYLILYQPIQMYFDDKKKQALDLFLKTLGVFAAITIILLIVVFSGFAL